jgi:hypothetical protein
LVGPRGLQVTTTEISCWKVCDILDVPLLVRECMWYMLDGAPAHFSHGVRDVLKSTYHNWWLGMEEPTEWPSHSSDLNPPDFYLWEYL